MSDNKLVIRRLPPSMSEDDFLKQVSLLPSHDYFCFFEANSGLGPHSFSRAYINFLDSNDMSVFKERFDNYVFLDKDGHEYPAVVEQAMWHRSPKNGPFYGIRGNINDSESSTVIDESTGELGQSITTNDSETDVTSSTQPPIWIEQDPEFITFMEQLQAQKKRPQHSPIQTLETNLDELTNLANSSCSGNKEGLKVITPLIGYVNQLRSTKSSKKAK